MADERPDFDNNANLLIDGVVAVGTTATAIRIAASLNELTEYVIVENIGNSTITFGGSGVTVGNGLSLRKNQKATLSCVKGSPWFGIVTSGTVNLYVAEMGS